MVDALCFRGRFGVSNSAGGGFRFVGPLTPLGTLKHLGSIAYRLALPPKPTECTTHPVSRCLGGPFPPYRIRLVVLDIFAT